MSETVITTGQPSTAPSTPAPATPTIAPRVTVDPVKALDLAEPPSKILERMGQDLMAKKQSKSLSFKAEEPTAPVKAGIIPPEVQLETKTEAVPVDDIKATTATTPSDKKVEEPVKTPKTIKVGEKEYTEKELEELIKGPKPEIKPEPVKTVEPTKQQTPEEYAKWFKDQSDKWVNDTVSQLPPVGIKAEQMDKILSGGEEAVKALDEILRTNQAQAILRAKMEVANAYNPYLQALQDAVNPLSQSHQQLEQYTREQRFVDSHPEMKGMIDGARLAATELCNDQQYGQAWVNLLQKDEKTFFEAVTHRVKENAKLYGIDLSKKQETPEQTKEINEPPKQTEPKIEANKTTPQAPVANLPKGSPTNTNPSYSSQVAKSFFT